ncbi:MAG: Gfo/Idh/MocA family oxidoreductase [Ruaniaceae bacterium]|nr:Gfo/Idh/MocA family oxidoreductase [Ruaniaceae bacterium]
MTRIGIVGTNFISDWFVEAARATGGRVEASAVYSRTQARAEEFAARHGIQGAFDEFNAMIAGVDAVYIASPTSAHFPQAMAAIEAGCHVLVEKTITSSLVEAQGLFERAEGRGVVVMEAARHIHTPEFAVIRGALGQLGVLRYACFEMLQYSSRYDRFRAGERMNAFDPALGNAALVDIGVYPLEAALDLFGEPASHTGTSVRLENGFEGAGSLLLDYGSMSVAVAYSKIAQGSGVSSIAGEDGELVIDSLSEPSRIEVRRRGEVPQHLLGVAKVRPAETMRHELIAFADQVEAGAIDPRWRNVTLAARRIMDEHLAR